MSVEQTMSTETPTLASLADLAYHAFTMGGRAGTGEAFVSLTDDAPDWVYDLVREAHGTMFPDDWRYSATRQACSHVSECEGDTDPDDLPHEIADALTDVYTMRLTAWMASHIDRVAYVDQAREESLVAADAPVFNLLQAAQYVELFEIASSVVASLVERLEEVS